MTPVPVGAEKSIRNAACNDKEQVVILSGIHDIKNLKLAIRDENYTRFNSPWNIAEDFRVDMSFSNSEIESMLIEYCSDTGIKFDTSSMSGEIYNYTSGYPYLVSQICKIIDERLERQWNIPGVQAAVKEILNEKSTLFDDVMKNIRNNSDIRRTVYNLLIKGRFLRLWFSYLKDLKRMWDQLIKNRIKKLLRIRIFYVNIKVIP